jgi:hypothetical protein
MRNAIDLTAAALFTLLLPASGVGEDVLFEDDFNDGLSAKWEVVGLKKRDYRIRDGALELRVQPGPLAKDTPMLKVDVPHAAEDTVIVSVKVTVLDDFTRDHEFAGVYLIDEDGREFGAKQERIDGKLVFAPGHYEFKGLPGEEGDPARYDVKYTPATTEAGPLRIIVRNGYAHFQVGPSADDKYLNFFHSAIRRDTEGRGFALIAVGAPKGASHWVRFDDFRVWR